MPFGAGESGFRTVADKGLRPLPVPGILRANGNPDMVLTLTIKRGPLGIGRRLGWQLFANDKQKSPSRQSAAALCNAERPGIAELLGRKRMRPRAILFDLDDTLLINDMDQFIPAYFKLLGAYAADRFDPRLLIQHLLTATDAMLHNTDPAVTNEQAFWDEFSRLTGFDPVEMTPFFHRFYETRFDGIRPLTQPRPEARSLVEWAFAQGYQVAIATNPMFPLVAVERRLDWAGLGVDRFDYDLITTYENMRATSHTPLIMPRFSICWAASRTRR